MVPPGRRMVGEVAAAITKRAWVNYGLYHGWEDDKQGQGDALLRSRRPGESSVATLSRRSSAITIEEDRERQ